MVVPGAAGAPDVPMIPAAMVPVVAFVPPNRLLAVPPAAGALVAVLSPKLNPAAGGFGASGASTLSADGVPGAPPKPPKLNPPVDGFAGSVVDATFALSVVAPRLPNENPPALGASADIPGVAGLSFDADVPPRLPKLNPVEGALGGSEVVLAVVAVLEALLPPRLNPASGGDGAVGIAGGSILSAGFAPNRPKPPVNPVAGGLLGSGAGVVDGVADLASVIRAGLAPKENIPPEAGEAKEGVLPPVCWGCWDAPPNKLPVGGVVVAAGEDGFAPNKLVVGAVAEASAGLAPNKLPPASAAGACDGDAVPDAGADPNKPPPVPAGLAPNKLDPELAGGVAAGVVDCPSPPNKGLETGVVDLTAGVFEPELVFPPPKLNIPPEGAGAVVPKAAVVVGVDVLLFVSAPPNEYPPAGFVAPPLFSPVLPNKLPPVFAPTLFIPPPNKPPPPGAG